MCIKKIQTEDGERLCRSKEHKDGLCGQHYHQQCKRVDSWLGDWLRNHKPELHAKLCEEFKVARPWVFEVNPKENSKVDE